MAHVWEQDLRDLRAVTVTTRGGETVTAAEAIARKLRDPDTGKPFGPTTCTRLLGRKVTNSTVKRIRQALAEGPAPQRTPDPAPPAAPPAAGDELPPDVQSRTLSGTADETTADVVTARQVRTLDDLLDVCGFDGDAWEVVAWESSVHHTAMRLRRRIVERRHDDGTEHLTRLEDEPVTVPAYRVRARFRPRHGAATLRALAAVLLSDLAAEADGRPAPVPYRRRAPGPGHLVVLHAPDLHAGKAPADGSEWDAPEAFRAALDTLLERAAAYDVGRVLLTVGNDALNVDGSRRSTTRGTPQDNGHEWREHFRALARMYRHAVDRALELAPVRAVVVPGNHDRDACFHLGEVLGATFGAAAHVEVTNDPHPRTYHLHGACLLGLTHGDGCKITDLPRLMSEEAAAEWAQATQAREWLTGHRHRLEVQTIGSCVVRTSSALSPSDEWHTARGYTGARRAAEALVYDPDHGRVGVHAVPASALAPA